MRLEFLCPVVDYAQDAQFDADRWIYGLLQAELPVQILELPTLPGLFPSLYEMQRAVPQG